MSEVRDGYLIPNNLRFDQAKVDNSILNQLKNNIQQLVSYIQEQIKLVSTYPISDEMIQVQAIKDLTMKAGREYKNYLNRRQDSLRSMESNIKYLNQVTKTLESIEKSLSDIEAAAIKVLTEGYCNWHQHESFTNFELALSKSLEL